MTKEDIIDLMFNQSRYYASMTLDYIKQNNYEMALVNMDVCKAYLLNLRYIQEQEELHNASL